MSLSYPRANHNHVAEYQASSFPWLQELTNASNAQVNFPRVTRFLVISNPGNGPVKVAFSSTGIANSQYITIPAGSVSPRLEIKVKSLWVTTDGNKEVNILAGLTNVVADEFPDITGWPGIKGEA